MNILVAAHWGKSQSVLLTIAILILLVLVVLMSTCKPGPASPSDDVYRGEPARDAGADQGGDGQGDLADEPDDA